MEFLEEEWAASEVQLDQAFEQLGIDKFVKKEYRVWLIVGWSTLSTVLCLVFLKLQNKKKQVDVK